MSDKRLKIIGLGLLALVSLVSGVVGMALSTPGMGWLIFLAIFMAMCMSEV